ncbi:MAG TPA: serine hydrolase [Nocardioides sp.]|nr:serine hydrolase [uncultured Nocardioides sp.]HEX5985956.1 serine hydrolase [Nocardioides sp.]
MTETMTGLRARLDELADALIARGGPAVRDGGPVVSVWLGDLDGRVIVERDADVPHYAASTMKLPLLVAALRRHESGELDLDHPVPVHNRFASAADGSAFSLDRADDQDDETWAALGEQRTLRTLAEHMTVKSGNLATNLVLEHVGAGAVAEVLSDAGASPTTVLTRGIEDAVAREAGLDNLVTAEDLGRVLCRVRPSVEEVLARQEHRDGIPAGLPEGTYVANKTGWVDGVTHDVALVRPDGRPAYVLVVLTTVDVSEDDAHRCIAGISRAVWDCWTEMHA